MQQNQELTLCIAGATGWTGQALVRGVLEAPDLSLRSAVSRSAAGGDLGEALGGEALGIPVYATVREALGGIDVLIDYTSVTAVKDNTLAAIEAGVSVVIGTSGLTAQEARGANVAGTQVHSVRLPSFVVSTGVVFGLSDERLTIRHDAGGTPEPYVAGTLVAVRETPALVGLTRGLDTLLLARS
jgi:dihydrodipicolinate reductase